MKKNYLNPLRNVILVFFFLSACSSPTEEKYVDPPTIPVSINTPCPPVTPVSSPIISDPKLIYILVDRSGSYSHLTYSAIQLALQGLGETILPGDQIYFAWIGKSSNPEEYLIYGRVEYLPPPNLTPNSFLDIDISVPSQAVSDPITVTPTPSSGGGSILQDQLATETASAVTKTAAAVGTANAAATANQVNEQKCNQIDINDANKKIIAEWIATKNTITNNYVQNTLTPLLAQTPSPSDNETRIYEALFIASRVIQSQREKFSYSSYKLLIFSDMADARSSQAGDLRVDFSNVDVLVAMMYCEKAIFCQDRADYWNWYFEDSGANTPIPFKIVQETTIKTIVDFLSQ